jgi:hypothetical protein
MADQSPLTSRDGLVYPAARVAALLDTNSNLLHGARAEIRAAAVATASASSRLR